MNDERREARKLTNEKDVKIRMRLRQLGFRPETRGVCKRYVRGERIDRAIEVQLATAVSRRKHHVARWSGGVKYGDVDTFVDEDELVFAVDVAERKLGMAPHHAPPVKLV